MLILIVEILLRYVVIRPPANAMVNVAGGADFFFNAAGKKPLHGIIKKVN